MTYPNDLTTSDWVDYLAQPDLSRDDKIAALATYHRRIEEDAQLSALELVRSHAAANVETKLTAVEVVAAAVAAVPQMGDYQPADQSETA